MEIERIYAGMVTVNLYTDDLLALGLACAAADFNQIGTSQAEREQRGQLFRVWATAFRALAAASDYANSAPDLRRHVFADLPAIAGAWLAEEERGQEQPARPVREVS